MPLLRYLSRPRVLFCQQCVRGSRQSSNQPPVLRWAADSPHWEEQWKEQATRIRSGAQKSMLSVLEERGYVKDVAGGRQALDWLLTEKPIGVYVGVDPTAPSLHVGHLLPLMAMYWMYMYGFFTVSLLGGGTVEVGDPSGRMTARTRQSNAIRDMNSSSMRTQLDKLFTNAKALGIKHGFPMETSRSKKVINNKDWLQKLQAVELMRTIGSGMRLGPMLNRDSVKMRMEGGEGMSIAEFCYPLFQAYDWWTMFNFEREVQLQIGGSDQYGNICAGMDAVSHMRSISEGTVNGNDYEDPKKATFGLTTPLLTTASGEKFGKSAGNAVWLYKDMLSSFDLYQYFLRTSDDDVERYLKLFTFLSLEHIELVMQHQRIDPSQRVAQHLLAKEIVELAHGAADASKAESAHKESFSLGTGSFSLLALRPGVGHTQSNDIQSRTERLQKHGRDAQLTEYRIAYAASSGPQHNQTKTSDSRSNPLDKVITLPRTLFRSGSFPQVLVAAGFASSKSEAHRMMKGRGVYVVVPNSGTAENPTALKWEPIPEQQSELDPTQYLVDWEFLVLRHGKSKIQVCKVISEQDFDAQGLTCPGWEDFRAKQAEK
ncbi:tyrosyl-tRNA synthetase-like protein [Polyplosphaeria fusca]|uniref:Tyrosine--tRNA ligase n=1 Tax=Polyplosphaeria fusca TaxID=682080 RepID=A0A9P4V7T1_9PLEO|nr:tyrosyl-tRNA synthetase-like protein [Polyplosphaeria fusca]